VASMKAAPRALMMLLQCWLNPQAVVVISHPFNIWLALFIRAANAVIAYDDGIAYYVATRLPRQRRAKIYRAIVAKHFRWTDEGGKPVEDYRSMLASSRVLEMHAMYPDLLQDLPMPVVQIDLGRAFPPSETSADEPIALYLDSAPEVPVELGVERVIDYLQSAAASHPSGTMWYRPHPSAVSKISQALAETPWARRLDGVFEEIVAARSIDALYSFHSSGALLVRHYNPDARIVNFTNKNLLTTETGAHQLFERIGAHEIAI